MLYIITLEPNTDEEHISMHMHLFQQLFHTFQGSFTYQEQIQSLMITLHQLFHTFLGLNSIENIFYHIWKLFENLFRSLRYYSDQEHIPILEDLIPWFGLKFFVSYVYEGYIS